MKETEKKSPVDEKKIQNTGSPFTQVVGIDVANSTIKVWTEGEKNISYRNTIKAINDAGLVYSFKTDYQMYVYNKEVYEVGDITSMGSGRRGKSRFNSEDFKIEAIIGITSILEPGVHEKLRVVTGVPSYLAKNNTVIDEIKANLMGSHNVKSVQWDKVNDISFDILDVIVVPQPLGTMYNYVYNNKTHELDQKLLSQRAIVIDIGWGTLDLAILESGRVRSTFGFDIGTSDYISGIQEEVNTKIPEANIYSLNPHQLDIELLKSTTVETPFGQFDLSAYVEKHKELQAKRVVKEIMSLGLEFNKFYKIICTGGGSIVYEKYLRSEFSDPRLLIQENAVMSNCRGFYLLGKF